jgi:hypothetical protein
MTNQTFQDWVARQDQRTSPNVHYIGDIVRPQNPKLTHHYRITQVHPHYWRAVIEHPAIQAKLAYRRDPRRTEE